jgi:hypothetical protein
LIAAELTARRRTVDDARLMPERTKRFRHCERSEASNPEIPFERWIASSLSLLANDEQKSCLKVQQNRKRP